MIIRIYATESGQNWDSRALIWRSDRQDVTVSDTYYPAAYDVKLTVEAGKIGTLKFVISPEHPYYNTFRKKKTILTVIQDGTTAGSDGSKCLFRGAVSEINVDIYQQATITATDALGYLEDSLHVPTGKNGQKKTRSQWLSQALSDHNSQMGSEPEKKFTLGTVGSFQGKINEEKEVSDTNYSDNMSFIKSNVMDSCNGYLRVRYDSDFSHRYLDFLETYGTTATQKLQFAINIEEISHEDISDDIYTVLVPVGKNAKTLEGYGNGTTAKVPFRNMSGEWETGNDGVTIRIVGKNVEIPDAISKYGYIYKPVSFSDKSTQEAIFEEAKKYISNTYREDNFTLKVKAIDLHYLEDSTPSIRIGDKVTVIRHSKVINSELIERKVIAMCSAIDYDFSSPENTEYTIGTNLENLTNSAGGGGNSSSGSGGGYGGSFHDCIGYMVGDMAVIDHEITQINGGLLDINTSITNINSEIIRLAGRVTITYTYMQSMYSDLSTVINWTYGANESLHAYGEMYEQWLEFQGSTVIQTMDQWGSFVGLWYATYDANGNFLGYVYRNGGGLFIQENDTRFGIFHDGNVAGGVTVHWNEATGKYELRIKGDWVDIDANERFTAVAGDVETDHAWLGLYKNRAELLVDTLVDYDSSGNPIFDSSGIVINPGNLSFGVYRTGTDGSQVLDAGVIVGKINNADGADVYIKGTKIKIGDQNAETVINGKLNATDFTAVNVRNLFQGTDFFHADVAQVDNFGAYDNLFVTRQLYDILLPAHSVLDAVIAFDQDNISYANNTISIPYKTLGDVSNWKYLTFNNVTSVTGSWSDNVYTVKAGTVEKLSFAIGTRFRNTQNGYSIEAYRIDSGSSTQIGIENSNTYYQLGSTVVGKNTVVSVMDTSNPPSTIYSAPLYTVDMSVTGSWTNNVFNYWSIGNKDGTKESTTITQRYGYTDSSGTWHGGGWTKNDSNYYVTYAEVQNGTTTLSSQLIYGTTPYNYGLKDAQVNGRWIGLTFYYWNTSVGDNLSTNKLTTVTLKYGYRASNGQWQDSEWTTDSSGKSITYVGAFNGVTSLSESLKITAPTKGLYVDTANHQITLSAQSTTESISVSATATITYDSSTHKYTANGTAAAGGTQIATSSRTGGSEAYNAGIDDGRTRIIMSFPGSTSSVTSGATNLTAYGTVYKIQANYLLASGAVSEGVTSYYVKTPSDRYSLGWTQGGTATRCSWTAVTSTGGATPASLSYGQIYKLQVQRRDESVPTLYYDVGTASYYSVPADRYSIGWDAGGKAAALAFGGVSAGTAPSPTPLEYNQEYIMYAYYSVYSGGTALCDQGIWYVKTPSDRYSQGWNEGGYNASPLFTQINQPAGVQITELTAGAYYQCYAYYYVHSGGTALCAPGVFYYHVPAATGDRYSQGWNDGGYNAGLVYTECAKPTSVEPTELGYDKYYMLYGYYSIYGGGGTTLCAPGIFYYHTPSDRFTAGYSSGWKAARSEITFPATKTFSSNNPAIAVFSYPSTTVSSRTSRRYVLTMESTTANNVTTVYAYLRYSTVTGSKVALNSVAVPLPSASTVTINYNEYHASAAPTDPVSPTGGAGATKLNRYTMEYTYLKITAGGQTKWFYFS